MKNTEAKKKFPAMWSSGMKVRDIARTFGVCTDTVQRWKRKHGLANRKPLGKKRDLVRRELFRKLWLGGASHTEIKRALGISSNSVICRWREDMGLPRRERRKARPEAQ